MFKWRYSSSYDKQPEEWGDPSVTAWLGVLEAGDETASGNKIEALSCPLLPHMTLTSPVQEAANVGDLVYASVKLIAKLLWAPGTTLSWGLSLLPCCLGAAWCCARLGWDSSSRGSSGSCQGRKLSLQLLSSWSNCRKNKTRRWYF